MSSFENFHYFEFFEENVLFSLYLPRVVSVTFKQLYLQEDISTMDCISLSASLAVYFYRTLRKNSFLSFLNINTLYHFSELI